MNILLIYGGMNVEYEISLLSAKNVTNALRALGNKVFMLEITRKGIWQDDNGSRVMLGSDDQGAIYQVEGQRYPVDIAFPIAHGTRAEDGTLSGLLEALNLPYVGNSVAAAAISMNKITCKTLLEKANLPVVPFTVAEKGHHYDYEQCVTKLGPDMFIKAYNLGSSVGVYKVSNKKEFDEALHNVWKFSDKALIERTIFGRELECAVLGNLDPIASCAGEIIPKGGFYSYENKYIDAEGAVLNINPDLDHDVQKAIRKISIAAFLAIGCRGLARVDFLLDTTQAEPIIYINEINAMPGFTDISMYPMLWESTGIKTPELVQRLLDLAMEEHIRKISYRLIRQES